MRKLTLSTMLAASIAVSGCAAGLGGYGDGGYGGGGGLGGILGGILGGGGGAYADGNIDRRFADAAVNACGQRASQYGRVSIANVRQVSSNTLRVEGRIDDNGGQRGFNCDFRSDGRITAFRT